MVFDLLCECVYQGSENESMKLEIDVLMCDQNYLMVLPAAFRHAVKLPGLVRPLNSGVKGNFKLMVSNA